MTGNGVMLFQQLFTHLPSISFPLEGSTMASGPAIVQRHNSFYAVKQMAVRNNWCPTPEVICGQPTQWRGGTDANCDEWTLSKYWRRCFSSTLLKMALVTWCLTRGVYVMLTRIQSPKLKAFLGWVLHNSWFNHFTASILHWWWFL